MTLAALFAAQFAAQRQKNAARTARIAEARREIDRAGNGMRADQRAERRRKLAEDEATLTLSGRSFDLLETYVQQHPDGLGDWRGALTAAGHVAEANYLAICLEQGLAAQQA